MATELEQTLLQCQTPDPNIRQAAEQKLRSAEEGNLPGFMVALVGELSAPSKNITVRQLAGLHLKNLLSAKDTRTYGLKVDRWNQQVPSSVKVQIRDGCAMVLRDNESVARHTAAQVVAEIGAIDLPRNAWENLMPTLLQNVTEPASPEGVKVSTLECLGYMSELMDRTGVDLEQNVTNSILTAIVDGMKESNPTNVIYAAATALGNSLLFCRGNMETKAERDMIMQVVCGATRCQAPNARGAAFVCICQIAEHYYDKLGDYMNVLFQLTFNAIKTDQEDVASQALEFWSTLCEAEVEILDEIEEANDRGEQHSLVCSNYVRAALEHLVPLLLETLTKQDEDADPDDGDWNLCLAGGACLQLVATTVEDDVVDFVMPFVSQSILNENWRYREAAINGFGFILDGPTEEKIGPHVAGSIPVLINCLKDASPAAPLIKSSTAWTLGKICELHANCVPPQLFPDLVNGLMSILMNDTARVSSRACFAFYHLGCAFANENSDSDSETNLLSGYMQQVITLLLQVTERSDWDESNLRMEAYETINVLIKNAAKDCKPLFKELLPVILQRMHATFNMQVLSNEDRDAKMGLQALLCGVITGLVIQIDVPTVASHSDSIMECVLKIFSESNGNNNSTAESEALLTIGAIADQLEQEFVRYVNPVVPVVLRCLQNFEAHEVCTCAVNLVGDLCRALNDKFQPYCRDFMQTLIEILKQETVDREVKPPVLSAFGDVAMAINGAFAEYMDLVMMMLSQASQIRVPDDDDDLIIYCNKLRDGILEGYIGIITGLDMVKKADLLLPHCAGIMGFLECVSKDINKDDGILKHAICCLIDLVNSLGSRVPEIRSKPFVHELIREGETSEDEDIRVDARCLKDVVQNLKF